MIGAIANFKYDMAIMNETDHRQSKGTYILSNFFTITSSIGIFLLALFFLKSELFKNNHIDLFFLFLLLFSIIIYSLVITINVYMNKLELFKKMARGQMLYGISYGLFAMSLGLISPSGLSLIYSFILSHLVQLIYLYFILKKQPNYIEHNWDISLLIQQAKTNIAYPKFNILSTFLNSASSQLPIVMFAFLYSSEIAGQYSMTVRIVSIPIALVGAAIGNVFFKYATDYYKSNNEQKFNTLVSSTFKYLLLIGSIPLCIIMVYGNDLFRIVLGSNWETAGEFAQLLSPLFLLTFVSSPLTHLFNVVSKQKYNLVFNIIFFVTKISSLLLTYTIYNDPYIAVLVYSLSGVLIVLGLNSYLLRIAKISILKTNLRTIGIFMLVTFFISIPKIIIYFIY
jgi:O-antigen/teichoic acid export membrane protein